MTTDLRHLNRMHGTEATDWRELAHCRDLDPNTMQPEVATGQQLEDAMAVCGPCPVWELCEQLAESQTGAYGVHAGHWYGDPPESPELALCQWCSLPVPAGATYCRTSSRCRTAAMRARQHVERVPA